MAWKIPPNIKIYEALGAVADKRVKIYKRERPAKVISSSREKHYEVHYEPKKKVVYSNDNGSYWQGYLGYPAVAFLMVMGELPYEEEYAKALKGIRWKALNSKYRSDYDKVLEDVRERMKNKGINLARFDKFVDKVSKQIVKKSFQKPESKKKPPRTFK